MHVFVCVCVCLCMFVYDVCPSVHVCVCVCVCVCDVCSLVCVCVCVCVCVPLCPAMAGCGDARPCCKRRWKTASCSRLSLFSSWSHWCCRLLLTALLGAPCLMRRRAATTIHCCNSISL